ncbi:MAG TPA: SRPBCC family protein [Nakamurella sp.]|nr:SRPBCC family protein [Nakamurella sp.]
MTVRVEASVDLSVAPATAFAALVDPRSQERWMIATKLYSIEGPVSVPQVGSRLAAFTGIGNIGFLDTMIVTVYDPPRRWIMDKDGDLLRGVGIMQVEPLGDGCRVTWANELEPPFGLLGRVGALVAKPIAKLGLQACLRRLAKLTAQGTLPVAGVPEIRTA